jgi:hypothetical protein
MGVLLLSHIIVIFIYTERLTTIQKEERPTTDPWMTTNNVLYIMIKCLYVHIILSRRIYIAVLATYPSLSFFKY